MHRIIFENKFLRKTAEILISNNKRWFCFKKRVDKKEKIKQIHTQQQRLVQRQHTLWPAHILHSAFSFHIIM